MTRFYGRSPKGQRLIAKVPHGHWQNITGICAIRRRGMIAAKPFVGGITNGTFLDFICNDLCPVLNRGDIVVMDNLQQHKQTAVVALIEKKGCQVMFLPPYSPDFNPIENCFSKVKTLLRKKTIREVKKLLHFIKRLPKLISSCDCYGYFKNAGYGP
jgi:transposase